MMKNEVTRYFNVQGVELYYQEIVIIPAIQLPQPILTKLKVGSKNNLDLDRYFIHHAYLPRVKWQQVLLRTTSLMASVRLQSG